MKTKFFTLFTALTLSAGALFASNTVVGGIYYDFDDANLTATVTYRGSSYNSYTGEYAGNKVIPATVTYGGNTYSVTSIGNSAFRGCSGLTSVTIGNSVTSIDSYAFEGCSSLTSVVWNAKNCADFRGSSSTPFYKIKSKITSFTFGSEVEHIPAYLCEDMENLTSVTIPNSVTSIGGSAFSGCSGLTSVSIGNSVTSIGGSAFALCSGLTSVTIPNSVTSIGLYAFRFCSGLISVVWNAKNCANFSSDGYAPFYEIASQIISFTFGSEVEHIPAYLCYGMKKLTSVTIPNSVTSIDTYAFYGCSGLTSVTIANSVTSIGHEAFYECSGLTSVVWNAKNCAYFSSSSDVPFYDSQITSFTFGSEVEHIPAYLCYGMKNLTSVTIPNSVMSIGKYAFDGCSGLTSVTIGNSVTSIGGLAFSSCSGLTSVTIPNSVTSIGEYAFDGCSGLTSVTIPNSVMSIGKYAFSSCSGLTSVTIPNSVMSIGEKAFSYCSGLTSVTIGNSVTSIGGSAFSGCSGLTSVVWNATNCADFVEYYDEYDEKYYYGPFYNIASQITSFTFGSEVEHIPAYLCDGMKKLTSVTIGNSVTSIGGSAFAWCSGLTSVTIPNSVTSIGNSAFRGCSGLTSVTIGNSVTSIGYRAFYKCSSLTSVVWNAKNFADVSSSSDAPFYEIKSPITSFTFGSEVEHIPAYLCYGMENLTSVTIPNSVTSIGDYAFGECSSLTSVMWNAKNCADFQWYYNNNNSYSDAPFYEIKSQITSFTFGSEVEHIPAYLCYGMENLTSVTIPNSVTSIGDYAFYKCSGLTSVVWNAKNCADFSSSPFASQITSFTFGSEVEHIPAYLCIFMNNLTSVTIPNSVTSIGDDAFWGCTALRDITALPTVPPTCSRDAFYKVPTDATLRCPCASREAYQAADTWSQFTNIIPADFPNVTLLADEEQGSVQVEDRICESKSVVISATANAGYHFVQWSNGATDATYTFILTQDTILTAEFALNQHKVMVTAGENGSVKVVLNDEETAETTFAYGTEIIITATADEGYCFVQWDDDNIDNPRTITVTEDITLSAEFAPSQTALETVTLSPVYAVDGRIVCEGEFRIYDLLGRDVTRLNGSLSGVYVVKTANAAQKVIVK